MKDDKAVSRRAALTKIAGLATVGYFAPTMSVMAEGHSASSSSSSASSVSSVSSASSAASAPSMSDASDWSAPSIASTGDATVDSAVDQCQSSSTSQESFESCLAGNGIVISN